MMETNSSNESYNYEPSRISPKNHIQLSDRLVHVRLRLSRPEIVLVDDFMADSECDELIGMAQHKLSPSTVVDLQSGGKILHEGRTSEGTHFQRNENPLIQRLELRISELLHFPIENGEGIQLLRYKIGGEYRPHFDFFPEQDPGSAVYLSQGGQRVSTLILYLNEVENGGETIFPDIHLNVIPRKGSALYFSYLNSFNQIDHLTLHGGAPVKSGEKWIATKWMRQNEYK